MLLVIVRGKGIVSRAQRNMKWCASEPDLSTRGVCDDPGPAVHRYRAALVRGTASLARTDWARVNLNS
jgi:hypothetical protein